MKTMKVYDKAKWHLESESSASYEEKLQHLIVIMDWLKNSGLLSGYGLEVYEMGVDEEFSLTSQMLTDKGRKILDEYYDKWLQNHKYGEVPSLEIFCNIL
ncbi:hypothetical protein P4S75_04955 [Anoxybacillus ayderensis]|uniref:hypothetical protein n=1 Tax=Anoxybacillus ayderensis TaxID=265546 RepID=UPI002E1BC136|nr:hypothetical protein [Anoxybacillus ayderensis]